MVPKAVEVLLVEDNPGDARLVQEMLNENGGATFSFQLSSSVRETMYLLSSGKARPEIVLIDLGLPDEQGLQTLRRIAPLAEGVPLVVLTGLRDEETGDAAVREGAQDFLYKEQMDGDRLRRVIRHAIERHRFQSQIRSALGEKEVLLREVYHRVKNNLQVIQSLLKMQVRALGDESTRQALGEMVQRVHAMALVHERLYQRQDLAGLSMPDYVRDLFSGAMASQSLNPEHIQLHLDAEEILLSLDRAVPLGLLMNELISNSLKHGFRDGRHGTIQISIHRKDGATHLDVQDDGAGLPEGFDPGSCPSMGLQVANSLAHQLGGQLKFSSQNGCHVEAVLARL